MATFPQDLADNFARSALAPRRHPDVEPDSAVDATYWRLNDIFRSQDAAGLRALCAEDALYVAPNAHVIQGAEAIAGWFTELFRQARVHRTGLRIGFDVETRGSLNGVIYDEGSYVLAASRGTVEMPIKMGRYLAVFRRCSGSHGCRIDTASLFPLLKSIPVRGPLH